ncbi:MAG: hypothetical protein ABIR11_04265 [Candidatus Limnocylindrales bacterium]
MILRIVRGHVAADRLPALRDRFLHSYAPLARRAKGLIRFHTAVRPVGDAYDLVVVTFWASIGEALEAYDGALDSVRVLDGLADEAELREVRYFEVDESQLRSSTNDAAYLRLTIGRVTRGADVEIQQELRTRMVTLEATMTEAYVGRRIVGDDVEVAFVSAWVAGGSSGPLDAPIWPDISARYDAFEVALYEPVVSGVATG